MCTGAHKHLSISGPPSDHAPRRHHCRPTRSWPEPLQNRRPLDLATDGFIRDNLPSCRFRVAAPRSNRTPDIRCTGISAWFSSLRARK